MGFAALSRTEYAMLMVAALVGAMLALMVGKAVANHMHSYNALHHGLGEEPNNYAHPFISRDNAGATSCTAVGAADTHWYYSCDANLHHNHSYQTAINYASASAHTEAFNPVLDHHHHFPH